MPIGIAAHFVLFLLAFNVSSVIVRQPLHHLMTKEEIKRYFAAEHLSNGKKSNLSDNA